MIDNPITKERQIAIHALRIVFGRPHNQNGTRERGEVSRGFCTNVVGGKSLKGASTRMHDYLEIESQAQEL